MIMDQLKTDMIAKIAKTTNATGPEFERKSNHPLIDINP
jgi:hypothetical protein